MYGDLTQGTRIEVGGVGAVVRQCGDPNSEEAVVFVHGNPGPSDDGDFIAEQIGDRYRVVLPDMPGFGRADRPRSAGRGRRREGDSAPAGGGR